MMMEIEWLGCDAIPLLLAAAPPALPGEGFGSEVMPWSHQIERAIFVGRWISLSQWLFYWAIHPPTYLTAPKMIITYTLMFKFGRVEPIIQKLCFVHMVHLSTFVNPGLFLADRVARQAVVHHIKKIEQAEMLVWITWHPSVVASPIISHLEVDGKLVWSGHEWGHVYTKGPFTWVPSHMRSICVILVVESSSSEVGTYYFILGPKS